ncbi:alpha/beta hydrolase [Streptomyces vastus]|uniref:AB hydrolase-1 domain-containing protein n=1 Tax=Streptomyces vastus TaxID=285451 RepID=A0ABN3Q7R3_9ACTN
MSTYLADKAEDLSVQGVSAAFTYRRMGPQGGVPLVLVSGFRGTIDSWDPEFLDLLAAGHDVILFDNVGIGYTTGEPRDSVEGFADGAIEFIEALGLAQVAVSPVTRLARLSSSRCGSGLGAGGAGLVRTGQTSAESVGPLQVALLGSPARCALVTPAVRARSRRRAREGWGHDPEPHGLAHASAARDRAGTGPAGADAPPGGSVTDGLPAPIT